MHQFPASLGRQFYFIQHDERVFLKNQPALQRRCVDTWSLPCYKLVVSQWLRDLVAPHSPSPVDVLFNPVDSDSFYPAKPRARNQRATLGFMYSDSPSKGCDLILDAIAQIREVVPDLRVLAFGQHPPSGRLPVPGYVQFEAAPTQDRIRELYSCCDGWLFGSRLEGFGLPILEAMACGTPVIATPAGAAPELVPDGGGILITETSSESICEAAIQLLRDPPGKWNVRSTAATQQANRHTWSNAASRFAQVLENECKILR